MLLPRGRRARGDALCLISGVTPKSDLGYRTPVICRFGIDSRNFSTPMAEMPVPPSHNDLRFSSPLSCSNPWSVTLEFLSTIAVAAQVSH